VPTRTGRPTTTSKRHYPFPENLTALGLELPDDGADRFPGVTLKTYDGRRFPFADDEFDICWSNAVVELVGQRSRQVLFLREIKRVARVGFVTTPNRRFPFEPHTRTPLLHLLSSRLFEADLRCIGKDWATGNYMTLLGAADLRAFLAEAGITRYRLFRNRIAGLTMDFVIIFECEKTGG
jgi:hypothetical protein